MFTALRAAALAFCGIKAQPTPQPVPAVLGWKQQVQAAGYVIYPLHGAWEWYHPASGGRSRPYTTEHGAWVAAKLDHDQWKGQA